ncbi:MAG: DNA-binding response regulator [Candidatus Leucobacter sulfamidivorax]|nr:DNA-binding response regulator [Candidatus Leucobacter sulfamidivorax]
MMSMATETAVEARRREDVDDLLNTRLLDIAAALIGADAIAFTESGSDGDGAHRIVSVAGYDDELAAYFTQGFLNEDAGMRFLRTGPVTGTWRDCPFDYRDSRAAQERFLPRGFADGMTSLVLNRRGQIRAALHASRCAPWRSDPGAVRAFAAIAQALAKPKPGAGMDYPPRLGEHASRTPSPAPALSSREREVVRLLALGETNEEIAAALCLSPRTVAHHLERISTKLGTRSRTATAVTAVRLGYA